MTFYEWANNNGYKEGLKLSRKNKNEDFCPNNCYFATAKEIANHKINNNYIVVGNQYKTCNQLSREYDISEGTIRYRINNGWDIEDALSENIHKNYFSYPEIKISKLLDNLGYNYKNHVVFSDCKFINSLIFDFIIFIENKMYAIEYDGQQHFYPVCFGKMSQEDAVKSFELIKKRDDVKNNYCSKNNIPLLRIPYFQLKDCEKQIIKFLSCG